MNNNVLDLVEETISEAFDFVSDGNGNRARFSVTANGFPTWVELSLLADGRFHAQTNDMDFMVGIPPTLCVSNMSDIFVHDAIIARLDVDFANANSVRIKLFREPVSGSEPIREGNSDNGFRLSDQVHFPGI